MARRDGADAGMARGRPLLAVLAALLLLLDEGAASALPTLPALPALRGLRRDTAPYKGFTGIRVRGDSARKVFYHDQTIAVVEASMDYNANRDLQNCELIEVNKASLAREALQNLSSIAKPSPLGFADMSALMRRCQELQLGSEGAQASALAGPNKQRKIDDNPDPTSLLSGILPGTKWCGTGDIAANYFDLGTEKDIDRCCRTHDLCPVKVRAFQSRYGLSNMSFYTKSHCVCDDMLLQCLKASQRPTANIMGNIYFNLLRVPCVEDAAEGDGARTARRYRPSKRY